MKTKIIPAFLVSCFLSVVPALVSAADGVEPPVPVRTVAPEYPEELRRAGTSGVVTISILIDEKGNVQEPKVIKTTHEGFSQPAVDAITKWKFKPAKKDGAIVSMRVSIPIQFTNKG